MGSWPLSGPRAPARRPTRTSRLAAARSGAVGELRQVNQKLHVALVRFWDRLADPARRPPGALPLETLLLSYQIEPPAGDSGAGPQKGHRHE